MRRPFSGSRLATGSSARSSRARGSAPRDATRCCCPRTGRRPAGRPLEQADAQGGQCLDEQGGGVQAEGAAPQRQLAQAAGQAVRQGGAATYQVNCCPTRAIRARASRYPPAGQAPGRAPEPDRARVGPTCRGTQRSRVVFPAPLGPTAVKEMRRNREAHAVGRDTDGG